MSSAQTPLRSRSILLDEGRWTVRFHATDIYGNVEEEHTEEILVDGTPPALEVNISGKMGDHGWYVSPLEIDPTATDPSLEDGTDGSGVSEVEYSPDSGGTWLASPPVLAIDQGGTTTPLFRARDNVGNPSEPTSIEVEIDQHAPEIEVSAEPDVLWPPNGKQDKVRLSGEISDQTSGPAALAVTIEDEYGEREPAIEASSLDPQETFELDEIIQLVASRRGDDKDGRTYTVHVMAKDLAGNQDELQLTVIVPHDQKVEGR
jgi:hypothetical protein